MKKLIRNPLTWKVYFGCSIKPFGKYETKYLLWLILLIILSNLRQNLMMFVVFDLNFDIHFRFIVQCVISNGDWKLLSIRFGRYNVLLSNTIRIYDSSVGVHGNDVVFKLYSLLGKSWGTGHDSETRIAQYFIRQL